jgi:hypothetical protein
MAIEPIAPDVTPETEQEWETRSQFRRDLLDTLDELLIAAEHAVEGGPEDGVRVVTHKAWIEILRATEFAPLTPIDRHYAEVVTGANVIVWATCPRCGIPGVINLQIDPELRVDTSSAELRLKAKAKPRTHTCGQLTIPALGPEVEGQESLNLEEMIGPRCGKAIPEAEVDGLVPACHLPEDHEGECAPAPAEEIVDAPADADADARDENAKTAARDDLLPGELRCEGSVHVPGCSCFDGPEFGEV